MGEGSVCVLRTLPSLLKAGEGELERNRRRSQGPEDAGTPASQEHSPQEEPRPLRMKGHPSPRNTVSRRRSQGS